MRTRPKAPSFRFLFSHPAHFLACGCGSGLSPWAPGTAGTAFAWLVYWLMRPWFSEGQFGLLLVVAYLLGIWCVHRTGRDLGEPDHGSIVWDEIVPFWLVLFMVPESWIWQLAAFAFFRLFDIVKWPPADWFDQKMKNGFGVMADDLAAAFHTLLAMAFMQWFLN
ncbi:MAG: Phosphatidylglycerophosphatase A [Betaproteobacteria bacterium ADurb.Bin341]|nr:MAG: Phosphatidylglycerophosphatase A [Betaproteobacteria bacterium ADurb.Bin341]